MKTIFTFILITIFSLTTFAQDKIYVHTATAENSSSNGTFINHPDLNGNPNAGIVYCHNYNPNGLPSVYNNNVDGLWYDGAKWVIFNEDGTNMIEGAHFNIYIASNPNQVITHISDGGNQGAFGAYTTVIDDSDFNGENPGPYAIMSNYWNPVGVLNNQVYGFYYDTALNKRGIYQEDGVTIPSGAAFKILKSGTGVISRFTHVATVDNTVGHVTLIDNANINGNPDASFVFQHYWGVAGSSSEESLNTKLSIYYTGSVWAIYCEDTSIPMPTGIAFDIIVTEQEILGANDNEVAENAITMFPNPATDFVNISTQNEISSITIFNILGQEVLNIKGISNSMQVDVSSLTAGNYVAKVQIGDTVKTMKLIKN